MAVSIDIANFGPAVVGLDWLPISDHGERAEIRELGLGINAAWQFIWRSNGECCVAFLDKEAANKKPVAASGLVKKTITDENYLILIDIGTAGLWSFAVVDGMPVGKLDRVGDESLIIAGVKDFIASFSSVKDVIVYSNQPEIFSRISLELDVRPFSLEILSHSISKNTYIKSYFSRYSRFSTSLVFGLLFIVLVGFSYFGYQSYAEQEIKQKAIKAIQTEKSNNIRKMSQNIYEAINSAPSASIVIPAYMQALKKLPMHIAGWALYEVICKGDSCLLKYKAQPFATWNSYIKAKPENWEAPNLTTDIEKIEQVVFMELPKSNRDIENLISKQELILSLGNLAQVSKQIGLSISLESKGQPVTSMLGLINDIEIPLKMAYSVTGSMDLLSGLAARLPDSAGVDGISITLSPDKTEFNLKGEAYAKP